MTNLVGRNALSQHIGGHLDDVVGSTKGTEPALHNNAICLPCAQNNRICVLWLSLDAIHFDNSQCISFDMKLATGEASNIGDPDQIFLAGSEIELRRSS